MTRESIKWIEIKRTCMKTYLFECSKYTALQLNWTWIKINEGVVLPGQRWGKSTALAINWWTVPEVGPSECHQQKPGLYRSTNQIWTHWESDTEWGNRNQKIYLQFIWFKFRKMRFVTLKTRSKLTPPAMTSATSRSLNTLKILYINNIW